VAETAAGQDGEAVVRASRVSPRYRAQHSYQDAGLDLDAPAATLLAHFFLAAFVSQEKLAKQMYSAGASSPKRAAPSTEDRPESLMDQLSRWQLLSTIDTSTLKGLSSSGTDDRDWTQRFCEDVVDPSYALPLPIYSRCS
jgi:hypothetical protein